MKNESKPSLYWKCQFLGWGFVSIYWAYTVFVRDDYSMYFTFVNYVLDVLTGIFLTHTYRCLILKNRSTDLNIQGLLFKIIPSIAILAFAYMLLANLKWHLYWTEIRNMDYSLVTSLLSWDPVFITGVRLMSIWLLAYHLYHYYINKIEITKANANLSVMVKQAQLDNLSAQLNPHFLFNSLNSIKSLVLEDPKVARRAIDLLSDLLRSSLYEKDKGLITIKEELLLVKDYIELEKLRFEERLKLELNMDKSIELLKIPTLSIQSLVENSIKHGIDKSIKGGIITINIFKVLNDIKIEVKNPGLLDTSINSQGLGLRNLQKRIDIQYKGDAAFHIKQIHPEIISATLTIPSHEVSNI